VAAHGRLSQHGQVGRGMIGEHAVEADLAAKELLTCCPSLPPPKSSSVG
jgi:hypothetical protein